MALTNNEFLRIAALILKNKTGEINLKEQAELDHLLVSDPAIQQLVDELENSEYVNAELDSMNKFDPNVSLQNFHRKHLQNQRVKLWRRFALAAAAITAITLCLWLYTSQNIKSNDGNSLYTQKDILPGKQGATLTLANGAKIRLMDAEDGMIAEQEGVKVIKEADGNLVYAITSTKQEVAIAQPNNILSTAKGETYALRLPDGSKVWLNAASSLTYPVTFLEGGKRLIKLEGEAYFEVAKDKSHPFIVEIKGQKIEVLGTKFNVSSYTDEEQTAVTTLLEGSVKISQNSLSVTLKPGEQVFSIGDQLKVRQANLEMALAWKNGDFYLNSSLSTIMSQLSKWYDVDVVYKDEEIGDEEFYAVVSRNKNLNELLKVLSRTGRVHFKVEGRRVMVMK